MDNKLQYAFVEWCKVIKESLEHHLTPDDQFFRASHQNFFSSGQLFEHICTFFYLKKVCTYRQFVCLKKKMVALFPKNICLFRHRIGNTVLWFWLQHQEKGNRLLLRKGCIIHLMGHFRPIYGGFQFGVVIGGSKVGVWRQNPPLVCIKNCVPDAGLGMKPVTGTPVRASDRTGVPEGSNIRQKCFQGCVFLFHASSQNLGKTQGAKSSSLVRFWNPPTWLFLLRTVSQMPVCA